MSAAVPSEAVSRPVSPVEAGLLFEGLSREARLLAAVSGGPDSIALLALLAEWAKTPGRPELQAATVDHGLRPEAAAEAEEVAALCRALGVPHRTLRWEGKKPGSAVQALARRARYALLGAEARRLGGAVLVTAHTLDDQAETMLMRLAHGSGPSGLVGMRERAERDGLVLVRPLLGIAKARLVATAQVRGLPFISDPSNNDTRFERVRWRAAMPLLAQRGVTAERLGRLAERMARLDAVADRRADEIFASVRLPERRGDEGLRLDFSRLAEEPEEIVLRVLALALEAVAPPADRYGRLERLEDCQRAMLAAAGAGVATRRTLSGCIVALGAGGVLSLRREGVRRRGVHPATS